MLLSKQSQLQNLMYSVVTFSPILFSSALDNGTGSIPHGQLL